jgi:methyl-accepting chemotaxis protein
MSGVSILVVLLFIVSIGRSISRPLAELKEVTDRIGKGDLITPLTSIWTMKLISWPMRSTDCKKL